MDFFDVGSTLMNEEKAYLHRLHDVANAVNEPFEKIYDLAINFYKDNRKGDLEVMQLYGLPLKIAALPIIVALIAATWIAVFFTSMSACFFNLLAFMLFAYSVIGGCMGDLHGVEFWKFLIASFAVFMVPNIAEWFILRLVDFWFLLWDFVCMK